ncbi:MAG: hypothetical protein HY821_12550 [Acidobacteria bacterium]|nr:hypothetical protein [Acidobacteriota bacterium]
MNSKLKDRLASASILLAALFTKGSPQNTKAQELVEFALLVGFIAVSVAATIPYQITTPISNIFSKIQGHLIRNGAN